MNNIQNKNGIYIHIPFCRSKCDYCSFYSIPVNDGNIVEHYLDALLHEIEYISSIHGKAGADTVYFGGGTPSILNPSQVDTILSCIKKNFNISAEPEITIEMNPDDLVIEKLDGFTDAGVNRIVLGVQSIDSEMRGNIGRRGKAVSVQDFELFFNHGGFTRCIDIICGLPGQDEHTLMNDLNTVTSYRPEHISLYLLSVEDDTPLGRRFSPDDIFDNMQADLWEIAIDFLKTKGYNHYEISNYALPGFESRHNSKYWDFTPYFGFGAGAHSFVNGERYSNRLRAEEYIKSREFLYEYDKRTADSIIVEFIMTTIRRVNGFSGEEFTAITGIQLPENIIKMLNSLENDGMIMIYHGRYSLTKKGLFHADSIIYKLTEPYL